MSLETTWADKWASLQLWLLWANGLWLLRKHSNLCECDAYVLVEMYYFYFFYLLVYSYLVLWTRGKVFRHIKFSFAILLVLLAGIFDVCWMVCYVMHLLCACVGMFDV